ncbi:hypothetical protein BTVI_84790 [Pitangus sulphuratus]|nr:hypothetical protein BTVI_84790 [Pitangus sulphuratus]
MNKAEAAGGTGVAITPPKEKAMKTQIITGSLCTMSYPQFGYPYSSAPQFLMSTNSLTTCCESSGRTLSETGAAASAQTPVYCPVYESRLLATARHELNSAAALGVYGGPYAGPQGYGNYVTYGTEAPAFYSLSEPSVICVRFLQFQEQKGRGDY